MQGDVITKSDIVFDYHDATKHHGHRYANALGYMDWENQPNPFRFYQDSPQIQLPFISKNFNPPYSNLYNKSSDKKQPITLNSIAALFELSLGISVWKKYGPSEWALRINPSSGNLHPTECYIIAPALDRKLPCIAHYNPYLHCLETRTKISEVAVSAFRNIGGFGIILTSIYWREAWKYGERAFRYCHHDVGHALGALSFSANLQGWNLRVQPQIGGQELDSFLGFDKVDWVESERERIDCLCWLSPEEINSDLVKVFFDLCSPHKYEHVPNRLSKEHYNWDIIDEVSTAARSSGHDIESEIPTMSNKMEFINSSFSAQEIIRRRRSAQAYDMSKSEMDAATFMAMLEKTIYYSQAPLNCFPYTPQCHLAIFIHNVPSLDPGLYIFVRNPHQKQELQSLFNSEFLWKKIEDGRPLYLLQRGDFRSTANAISCQQDIAGDSAFSLGMLTRFQPIINKSPWMYPRLFWETGLVGQILYLEAEAHDLRATGIGCFFDDEMHRLLGLEGNTYQSLYHFTVGYSLEDTRIQSKEPYSHLNR